MMKIEEIGKFSYRVTSNNYVTYYFHVHKSVIPIIDQHLGKEVRLQFWFTTNPNTLADVKYRCGCIYTRSGMGMGYDGIWLCEKAKRLNGQASCIPLLCCATGAGFSDDQQIVKISCANKQQGGTLWKHPDLRQCKEVADLAKVYKDSDIPFGDVLEDNGFSKDILKLTKKQVSEFFS